MSIGTLVLSECGVINDDIESLRHSYCRNIAWKEAAHSLPPTGLQPLDGYWLIDSVEKASTPLPAIVEPDDFRSSRPKIRIRL
ncbi:hypothetical protein [Mesorhizobium sp. ES1-4]|uniref:hypothetical protein n=1 Tax=Mesorhizobium sp. ES1-4 TaxID=2876627 RepID=UPI001CCBE580|nr:hypothetical protein [Mesorhizobium sp. ES1-4]MBZ9794663.1 hypothetical protein [Mesorhizobium sp. ES1-4]